MNHRIKELLVELGISSNESFVPFHDRVRDRDDVAVERCERSGVYVLSRSDHMDISHYEERESFEYWGAQDRKNAVMAGFEDTKRRFKQFSTVIAGRDWMDVGTGAGGILDYLAPLARQTVAVEPQVEAKKWLEQAGYAVASSVDEVEKRDFAVATLFHVFEHLTEPLQVLRAIYERLEPGGKVILEVPHAGDLLLSLLDLESFKRFTFWSEHLILHTRASLEAFCRAAGFESVVVTGFQRYPLANHLYWLKEGKPGGHKAWDFLRTPGLDLAYESMLKGVDATDTLIATATKGA